MARTTTIQCDFPGCGELCTLSNVMGDLENWLVRDFVDSMKLKLEDGGIHRFDGRTSLHFCPAHAEHAQLVPSPVTHPEVVERLQLCRELNPDAWREEHTDVGRNGGEQPEEPELQGDETGELEGESPAPAADDSESDA